MYISLKWVQNIVSLDDITLLVFCERLTLAGFEIEEIIQKPIEQETDFILDVSLTANRSDLFNIKEFSKELESIFYKNKEVKNVSRSYFSTTQYSSVKKSFDTYKPFIWEMFQQKKIFENSNRILENFNPLNFDSCFALVSLESETVEIKPSSPWLKKCLLASNIEPKNNVVDTLNFIRLETGYPFFALDLEKVKNYVNTSTFTFKTKLAETNQIFQEDANNSIKLGPNNLLLYINDQIVSIIGLSTLKELEIDNNTNKILLYGGFFDPIQIRKSSQSLGIRTEQSVSLEKNLNFNGFEQAFIRLFNIFQVQNINFTNSFYPKVHEISPLCSLSFTNYINNKRPNLLLKFSEVQNILGSSSKIEKEEIINILKALHFKILEKNESFCKINIPFARESDLEKEIDLIEEIVRISGFDTFASLLPNIQTVGKISKLEKLKRLLRQNLINLGLNEVMHYSISNYQSPNQLELVNPIIPESSFFRINLVSQLIQKAALNKKQKNNTFEAFEMGRVYSVVHGNIKEEELVSGIFGGKTFSSSWNEDGKTLNWFEAKGILEYIFRALRIKINYKQSEKELSNVLHPGRSAILKSSEEIVGFFGQIHPMVAKTNSLPDHTYLFELNLEVLKKLWNDKNFATYKPYSLFPASLIDLACIKEEKISYEEVEKTIKSAGGPLLESIKLFDYYAGTPIPEGYQSLGFKLKFRDPDKTLTNEEVEKIVKKIITSLEKNLKINVRN